MISNKYKIHVKLLLIKGTESLWWLGFLEPCKVLNLACSYFFFFFMRNSAWQGERYRSFRKFPPPTSVFSSSFCCSCVHNERCYFSVISMYFGNFKSCGLGASFYRTPLKFYPIAYLDIQVMLWWNLESYFLKNWNSRKPRTCSVHSVLCLKMCPSCSCSSISFISVLYVDVHLGS